MISPTGFTEEQAREAINDVLWFFRALGDSTERKKAISTLFTILGVGSLVGTLFCSVFAIGQIYAIGFFPAWNIYGWWWISSPFLGAVGALLIPIVPFVLFGTPELIAYLCKRYLPQGIYSFIGRLFDVLIPIVILSILPVVFIFMGYSITKQSNQILSSANSQDIAGLSKTVSQQESTLSDVSTSARDLLEQLEKSESELSEAKKELSKTLSEFDTQREAARRVTENLKELQSRRDQIDIRLRELENILGGQAPITKEDFKRSNNSSLIFGALIGFLTSVAATLVLNYVSKVWRASRKQKIDIDNQTRT